MDQCEVQASLVYLRNFRPSRIKPYFKKQNKISTKELKFCRKNVIVGAVD